MTQPSHHRDLRDLAEHRCRRLLDSATPLPTSDLAWHTVHQTPISDDVVACLAYMRDVEGFTDRDLSGFTAHRTTLRDPLIREFLDVWRAEEAEHCRVLGTFLDHLDRPARVAPRQLPPSAAVGWVERTLSAVGGPVGSTVCAAHMTWGAANELLTLNGYRLLAARCEHPVLATLLTRIAAQEARHYSFYFIQAQWRLASSSLARTVLRRVLARSWTPVGIGDGYKSADEFAQVLAYLGRDAEGAVAMQRMDTSFTRLPGLDGLNIYGGAATRFASETKAA